MKSIDLPKYRKEISRLVKQIQRLATRCLYPDLLIHAVASEVLRTCGRESCKCMIDKSQRHGPYKVIQIPLDGRKKQIALRKDQTEIWQRARNYQHQIQKLAELRKLSAELSQLVSDVIQKRTQEYSDVKQK